MSEPLKSVTSITMKPMEVFILGKVDARRKFDANWYTRIITPAPDAYSRPSAVEIRSKQKLGEVGEEIRVQAKLGGYTRKPYKSVDKDSGEIAMITPVDLTLEAIE